MAGVDADEVQTHHDELQLGEGTCMKHQHESFRSPDTSIGKSGICFEPDSHPLKGGEVRLPLYSFRYLDDDTVYIGLMAQDVLKVRPDAVITGDDGFYRVYYARLGLRMATKAEWDGSQTAISAESVTSPEPC